MAGFADFTYWLDGVPFTMGTVSGTSKYVFWLDGLPFSVKEAAAPDPLASFTFFPTFPDQVPHRKTWAHWQNTDVVLPPPPPFVEAIYPAQVPHRPQFRPMGGEVAPFVPAVIPVPDILHSETFQATFPDQVPHRRLSVANMQFIAQPPVMPSLQFRSWAPTYPDQVPHRKLAIALMPSVFEPPPGEYLRVAASMAWEGHYPAQVSHRRTPIEGGQPWFNSPSAQNGTFGVGECVTLQQIAVTVSTLINVQVTVPTLVSPAVTISTLANVEVC